MPPPFIRLGSRCNLLKISLDLRRRSGRSLAYATWTDVSSSSSVTGVLCDPLEKLRKFKVIETLDQLKRETSSGLLFTAQLKESGLKHDVETHMAIVRLLCHSGMDVRLHNLFTYGLENITREAVGFEISHLLEALIEEKLIKAVDELVKVYASVGRFEEAIHTLSEMKSKGGLVVSTGTCNLLMNKLIEWDKVAMAESVYTQQKSYGLIPNVYTYGILIKGYCRKGCLKEAWEVIAQMEENGVEPNAFIYGTYIHGLCSKGNTDSAYEVLKNLSDSNKPVDVFAYTCVIRGFVRESKLQEAEDVLLDMKRREIVPNAHCYGELIRGCCEKREIVKAYKLCVEMESRDIETNDVIVRSMMECLCGMGFLDNAVGLFKIFMNFTRVFIHGITFYIAIDAACRLGRIDDASGFLQGMKVRKMKPWRRHYETLMNGYFQHGRGWKALEIFEEMIRNGLRPDSATFDLLARGFVRCRLLGPLYILSFRGDLQGLGLQLPTFVTK